MPFLLAQKGPWIETRGRCAGADYKLRISGHDAADRREAPRSTLGLQERLRSLPASTVAVQHAASLREQQCARQLKNATVVRLGRR